MLELAVAPVMRRLGWPRPLAAAAVACACFLGGLATVFSFNRWSDWQPTPYELVDHLTSNVMLPAGGLALALFAGWALPRKFLVEELGLTPRGGARLHWLLRWPTPALIAAVAIAPAFLG
jgi:NSS family neurotransmitter:Na+ symporter